MTEDAAYIKSEAVLRIAQQLNMPLALLASLAFLVPKPLADGMYDQVRAAYLAKWALTLRWCGEPAQVHQLRMYGAVRPCRR